MLTGTEILTETPYSAFQLRKFPSKTLYDLSLRILVKRRWRRYELHVEVIWQAHDIENKNIVKSGQYTSAYKLTFDSEGVRPEELYRVVEYVGWALWAQVEIQYKKSRHGIFCVNMPPYEALAVQLIQCAETLNVLAGGPKPRRKAKKRRNRLAVKIAGSERSSTGSR